MVLSPWGWKEQEFGLLSLRGPRLALAAMYDTGHSHILLPFPGGEGKTLCPPGKGGRGLENWTELDGVCKEQQGPIRPHVGLLWETVAPGPDYLPQRHARSREDCANSGSCNRATCL